MAAVIPQQGVLRVVPPGALDRIEANATRARVTGEDEARNSQNALAMTNLASYIRSQYEMMRNHRDNANSGWSARLMASLRAFNGQYDAGKLQEIAKWGGSQIYQRLTANKCRGASSLLRDVYLQSDRPWGLDPDPDPDIPPNIMSSIQQLLQVEVGTMAQAGQQPDPNAVRDRLNQLLTAAREAAKKKSREQAKVAEDKIDEFLIEGNFYEAMAEFMVDLPMFPFACIKGPVVRVVPTVNWNTGTAVASPQPRLFWERKSPFDIWWTPGVADIENAAVIERQRLSRADLNDLLDLPGYNKAEIRAVLDEYGRGGLTEDWDTTDAERASQESRENPILNRSGLISCLEYQRQRARADAAGVGHGRRNNSRRDARLHGAGVADRHARHQGPALPEPPQAAPLFHHQLREGAGHASRQRACGISSATSKRAPT